MIDIALYYISVCIFFCGFCCLGCYLFLFRVVPTELIVSLCCIIILVLSHCTVCCMHTYLLHHIPKSTVQIIIVIKKAVFVGLRHVLLLHFVDDKLFRRQRFDFNVAQRFQPNIVRGMNMMIPKFLILFYLVHARLLHVIEVVVIRGIGE